MAGTSCRAVFRSFPGISVPRWDGYHQVQVLEITRAWRDIPGFAVPSNPPGCEQGRRGER